MQDAGQRVLGHGQRIARPARGRRQHVAAPQIAQHQVAGAGRPLVKPLELWRTGAQVTRKRPSPANHLRFGEQAVALLAAARTRGARRQVAQRGKGWPGLANFPVVPAASVASGGRPGQRPRVPAFLGTDALEDAQHIDVAHRRSWPVASLLQAASSSQCRAAVEDFFGPRPPCPARSPRRRALSSALARRPARMPGQALEP